MRKVEISLKPYFAESIEWIADVLTACVSEAGMPADVAVDIFQDALYTLARDCFQVESRQADDWKPCSCCDDDCNDWDDDYDDEDDW